MRLLSYAPLHGMYSPDLHQAPHCPNILPYYYSGHSLLSMSGFEGELKTQTEETKALLQTFLVGGLTVTFLAAVACSRGINLRKQDIERAQQTLAATY